jgi:hypothetical protein
MWFIKRIPVVTCAMTITMLMGVASAATAQDCLVCYGNNPEAPSQGVCVRNDGGYGYPEGYCTQQCCGQVESQGCTKPDYLVACGSLALQITATKAFAAGPRLFVEKSSADELEFQSQHQPFRVNFGTGGIVSPFKHWVRVGWACASSKYSAP